MKKINHNIIKLITFFLFLVVGNFLFLITDANSYGSCTQYGVMAYEDYTGYCKCMSGYVFGKNFLGESYCVSGDSVCKDDYGYGARYDSLIGKCECSYDYLFGEDIIGRTQCIEQNQYCRNKYGYNSKYNSLSNSCECGSGYEMTQKSIGSGLECVSCTSKYGIHSSYDYFAKKCECDSGYTLNDESECVEKQNNVYFILKEVNTDEKLVIIKSEYDNKYYFIEYGYGCYSSSIGRYLNHRIVVNLGTDFDVDRWDKIVLFDDDEVCDIKKVERVYSDFTLEPDEEDEYSYPNFSYVSVPAPASVNNNIIQNKTVEKVEEEKQCNNGYALSINKTNCIKIPEHAHVIDSPTDVWFCDEGYKEFSNSCIIEPEEVSSSGDNENMEVNKSDYNNKSSSESDNKIKSMTGFISSLFSGFFRKITSWFGK